MSFGIDGQNGGLQSLAVSDRKRDQKAGDEQGVDIGDSPSPADGCGRPVVDDDKPSGAFIIEGDAFALAGIQPIRSGRGLGGRAIAGVQDKALFLPPAGKGPGPRMMGDGDLPADRGADAHLVVIQQRGHPVGFEKQDG